MKALTKTDFHFEGQKSVYHGKVRDVYDINDDVIVMVATDRISAFDVILPKGIPFKGQVLNQIAAKFLDATTDICPNWKLATPDPMVTVGLKCEGFRVEMIIRSILTGSAWRAYKEGCRELCGVKLPEGMKENQRFPEPIITPTTKADEGHDMNISKEEIIAQGIVSAEDYAVMEDYTRKIFARGQEMAAQRGLILGQLCSRCNLRRHLHHRAVAGKQSFAKRNTCVVILRVGGSFLQCFALVAIAVDSTDGIVKLWIAWHKQLATLSAHRYQVACVGGIYRTLVRGIHVEKHHRGVCSGMLP